MKTIRLCDETIKVADKYSNLFGTDEDTMRRHWTIKPGDVCVDAGFGPGTWTLVALAKGGITYSFDPKPLAVEILTEHVDLNGFKNCTIVPTGLWKTSGSELFNGQAFKAFVTAFTTADDLIVNQYASVISLDSFFAEHQIDHLDYMNIDVEWSEMEVIQGARATISRFMPKIIIEVHEGIVCSDLEKELTSMADYKFTREVDGISHFLMAEKL